MDQSSRQLKSTRDSAKQARQALISLLLLALVTLAQAIQPEGNTEAPAPVALRSSVTPLYLEKSTSPHTLKPEDGWQVGGLNTNFASTGDAGALNFTGGYYFSRTLAPRQLLDPRDPLPSRFGQDGQGGGEMPTFFRMFDSGPSAQQDNKDQITFQRWGYKKDGLSFSGGYSEVGADFKGLDVLTQRLNGSDPATAKSLALGLKQQDYTLGYSGVRGLNFTSKYTQVENEQKGHGENGLTRTMMTNGVGLALGQRHKLDYTVSSFTEEWDPAKGNKAGKDVDTQALRLSGAMGRKSEFAVGQLLTSTTTGTNQTDVTQRDLAVKWNDWKSLAFSAGYTTKETEQAQERTDTLALDFAAPISSYFKLTGKIVQTDVEKLQSGQTQEQNLLDLKLASQLTPRLLLTSQYQDSQALDATTNKLRDYQLAYALTPRWKTTYRVCSVDNSTTGEMDKVEYGVIGQVGTTKRPRRLSLYHRDETLPNAITQGRTELAFSQPLGRAGSPVTLQVKAGAYDYASKETTKQKTLVTMQLIGAQPTKRTSLSIGYYDGPVVGANALTYRAWGQKVQANPDTVWKTTDMAEYGEVGGELVHALTDHTKVVAKQYAGEIEGQGDRQTTEYGIEHRFGKAVYLAGQRDTEMPGQQDQTESWWRVTLPSAQKLPAWAAGSLRLTAFSDGASWGLNQAPAWAVKPVPGLEVGRRNVLIGGKRVDGENAQYACMFGSRLFLQGSYERNPNKPNNANEVDAIRRGLCHLAYTASPKVTLFGRYTDEGKLDGTTAQRMRSIGFIGAFSKEERLQLQMDIIRQSATASTLTGIAYTLEYERAVSADDSLSLKARLNAEEFTKAEDRLRLECSYRKTF